MIKREKKRAELGDPIAMVNQGHDYLKGHVDFQMKGKAWLYYSL